MKKYFCMFCLVWLLACGAGMARAVVIDFTGGIATLSDGSLVVTNDVTLHRDIVDYYVEDGIRFDFIGGFGTIGDYYSIGAAGFVGNSIIHAHWDEVDHMLISREDGAPFDLNYLVITSNATNSGGQETGLENSYVTNDSGQSMLLPSSDWGFEYDYYGEAGDGVSYFWLDNSFDQTMFMKIHTHNAYCFGLDNFYIDESPPPVIYATPEPASVNLLALGLLGFFWISRIMKRENL